MYTQIYANTLLATVTAGLVASTISIRYIVVDIWNLSKIGISDIMTEAGK